MLKSQEKQLRISEIRQRLNELAGKDSLTAEERAEVDTLTTELATVETQYRAAVQAEDTEAREHRAEGDGESAELRSLTGRVRCGEYLQAAVEQRAVSGAEAELCAAVGLSAQGRMPWAALIPRNPAPAPGGSEARADAATAAPADGIPTNQAEILARVFARSATAYLRVDMPSVGVGEASYPVFATGAAGEQAAKGGAVDADAATFNANTLKPKRLSAAYLWGVEDEAELRGLEEGLREDLGMAMSDAMDKQVLVGDGTGANIGGFTTGGANGALNAALPADQNAVATYADFRKLYTGFVDGKYANDASEVRALVTASTYAYADSVFRANESEDTGLMAAMRIGGGFRVSGNMPATASNNDLVLRCRGMARAAVAPVWQGLRLIRDEVTAANKGQIRLTAIALWNFAVIRADQYDLEKLKIA